MTCDCCGDDWEESFFCETCTKRATDERLGDEEMGGGLPHNVCGNCCQCHLIRDGMVVPAANQGVLPNQEDRDVPF